MCTVLSEVLVVALAAVPFSVATAYLAFEVSVYTSCVIIAVAAAVVLAVVVRWLSTNRVPLGRAPECIAEVVALVDDGVCARLGGVRDLDTVRRNREIRGWGFVYFLRG